MNHSNMASKQYVGPQCTSSPYDCSLGSLAWYAHQGFQIDSKSSHM